MPAPIRHGIGAGLEPKVTILRLVTGTAGQDPPHTGGAISGRAPVA